MKPALEQKNNRLALKLLVLVIGMMVFGVGLIPLYDVFTGMTGINGKLAGPEKGKGLVFQVDQKRIINLDFITSVAKGPSLMFTAEVKKKQVYPGQVYDVNYTVKNTSDQVLKVHANPSVTPGLAAEQFRLITCFCWESQQLNAGEVKQLTLRFVIDPSLPAQYKNIALSQQFFNTK